MEDIESVEKSQCTPRKRGRKRKSEMKESSSRSGMVGPRRTRSQVAPDWTIKESLILVNEISAVEGDCLKALSSYQKWKIIVENCAALEVPRTLNQCRSKWNSLIADYNQIRRWESNSTTYSYWSMDSQDRKQSHLPENFDYELFIAIDNYVKAQDHSDTEPDTDPEAEADLLNVIAKLGSKRHRRHSISLKIKPKEEPEYCCDMEQPQNIHAEVEPQKSCQEPLEIQPEENYCAMEQPQNIHAVVGPHKSREEPLHIQPEENYCAMEQPQNIHAEVEYQKSCEQPLDVQLEEDYCAMDQPQNIHAVVESQRSCEEPQNIHAVVESQRSCEEPLEIQLEENYCAMEQPQNILAEVEPQKSCEEPLEIQPEENYCAMEQPQKVHAEVEPQKSCEEPQNIQPEEKPENFCEWEQHPKVHVEVEPEKNCEVNPQMCFEKEMPQVIHHIQELGDCHLEEKSQEFCGKGKPQTTNAAEEPQQSLVGEKPKARRGRKKKIAGTEEEKQVAVEEEPKGCPGRKKMTTETHEENQLAGEAKSKARRGPKKKTEEEKQIAWEEKPKSRGRPRKKTGTKEEKQMAIQKLCENAELIHAIAQGNFPGTVEFGATDGKNIQDFKTDFVRRQGHMLIACLGDIAAILDKFPDLVQECLKFSSQSNTVA